MKRLPTLLAVIAIVVLTGAMGCGVTRTKAGLTRAQFIARADAICRAEDEDLTYVEHRAAKLEGASIGSFRGAPRR